MSHPWIGTVPPATVPKANRWNVPATSGPIPGIKMWTGAAWVSKPAKVYNGATWDVKPVKYWSGSAWLPAHT